MTNRTNDTFEALLDALRVIVLDPAIAAAIDPKALEQAQAAIKAAQTKEIAMSNAKIINALEDRVDALSFAFGGLSQVTRTAVAQAVSGLVANGGSIFSDRETVANAWAEIISRRDEAHGEPWTESEKAEFITSVLEGDKGIEKRSACNA